MRTFILTLQFLTRIPINVNLNADKDDFARGVIYFPVVGLIIGGFNLLIYYIADKVFDGIFPAVCCLLANCAITGALHIDGLADSCDGLFSARNKERMLEIMKDSRIGTNGAVAIIFDFLLRLSLITNIDEKILWLAILLSPVAAKTIVGLLINISGDARTGNGMGSLFMEKSSLKRSSLCVLIGIAIVIYAMKLWGLGIMLACFVVAMLFRSYVYSKIDGMTGDTFGAANEIIEIAFLIFIHIMRFCLKAA